MSGLLEIAKRQCRASRPAVTLKSFTKDYYDVGYEFLLAVDKGHRSPSKKLLNGMRNAHARLFPSETFPDFPKPSSNSQLN